MFLIYIFLQVSLQWKKYITKHKTNALSPTSRRRKTNLLYMEYCLRSLYLKSCIFQRLE